MALIAIWASRAREKMPLANSKPSRMMTIKWISPFRESSVMRIRMTMWKLGLWLPVVSESPPRGSHGSRLQSGKYSLSRLFAVTTCRRYSLWPIITSGCIPISRNGRPSLIYPISTSWANRRSSSWATSSWRKASSTRACCDTVKANNPLRSPASAQIPQQSAWSPATISPNCTSSTSTKYPIA